ncbi:diguanylate cyclase domain-containing protein [Sporosarcina luteola]|nr:diguanylate cyclase [Sporosarcina luteola]
MDAVFLNQVLMNGIQDILLVIRVEDGDDLFYEFINQVAMDRIGLTEESVGKRLQEVHHAEDYRFFRSNHLQVIRSKREFVYEDAFRSPRGNLYYSETRLTPLFDDNGDVVHIVVLVHDITDKKLAEDELENSRIELLESRDQFRIIAENSTDLIVLINAEGNVDYISPSTEDLLGIEDKDFIERPYSDFVHPDDVMVLHFTVDDSAGDNRHMKQEYRMKNSDGDWVWFELHGSAVFNEQGEFIHFVAVSRDISSRVLYEDKLKHIAYHDVLTDLPNRRSFYNQLTEALTGEQGQVALFVLDIDHFKEINDGFGHDRGDQVIKEFASRLRDAVQDRGTVARLGGDEFAVILQNIKSLEEVVSVAEGILQSIREPWHFGGQVFSVTTSIGVAISPVDGEITNDAINKQADLALYKAKEAGRNCFRVNT